MPLGSAQSATKSLPHPCLFQVMYRERAAGMYDELPFAVAQCLVEIPYNLVQSVLFAIISYWMLGFENNAGAAQYSFQVANCCGNHPCTIELVSPTSACNTETASPPHRVKHWSSTRLRVQLLPSSCVRLALDRAQPFCGNV
jgi:hypothetical protein